MEGMYWEELNLSVFISEISKCYNGWVERLDGTRLWKIASERVGVTPIYCRKDSWIST